MLRRRYQKLIMALVVLALLWFYTTFKLAHNFTDNFAHVCFVTIPFFILMIGWLFWYRLQPLLINRFWFRVIAGTGAFCLGWWTTFILLTLPLDIIFLLITWFSHYQLVTIVKITNLWLLALSLLLTFLGFIQAWCGPYVKSVHLKIANLPKTLSHLRMVQISDLHIGLAINQKTIAKVVKLTNAAQPDFIFVTGDLIDANIDSIDIQALAALNARFGIYYVTGNHEYYWQASSIIDKVKTFGWTVLLNENRIVSINHTNILIAGITDKVGGQFIKNHAPNLSTALQTQATVAFKILLAHRPEVYVEATELGVDLQLSGHTHGGQFFPFNLLMPLAHRYYRALHRYRDLLLYVNVGTGYWGPANRLGVPSEITLFTLAST